MIQQIEALQQVADLDGDGVGGIPGILGLEVSEVTHLGRFPARIWLSRIAVACLLACFFVA
jgi:hypothetical protein